MTPPSVFDLAETRPRWTSGMNEAEFDDHVVELDRDLAALLGAGGLRPSWRAARRYSSDAEARGVAALPLRCSGRGISAQSQSPRYFSGSVPSKLFAYISTSAIELLQRVGRARVAAEEHRRVDVAQLDLDADLVPPLLDQRLRRLAHRVGRGLVEDRQPLAVLLAHAVAPMVQPASSSSLLACVDVLLLAPVVVRSRR